jgi:hypothetical protein
MLYMMISSACFTQVKASDFVNPSDALSGAATNVVAGCADFNDNMCTSEMLGADAQIVFLSQHILTRSGDLNKKSDLLFWDLLEVAEFKLPFKSFACGGEALSDDSCDLTQTILFIHDKDGKKRG